jgi:membrane protease YdiL (CAAX protease family)
MPRDRMLRPGFAVGLWGALCLVGAFYGNWSGFGARPFAATLGAFAILLAGEICLASPGIREPLVRASGPQGGAMLALWPLGAYTLYALGTGSLSWSRIGLAVLYIVTPLALAASAHAAKPGAWQDYAMMLAIALPVRLGWLHSLFPYPEFRLGYILPMLLGINVGLSAFVFVRRMDGIGYSIGWGMEWVVAAVLCFAAVAAIDIPLGIAIHFVRFDAGAAHWRALPLDLLSIFVFTSWPEEFLFRGLLQNMLSKTLCGENAGLIVASIIFGLSHIDHGIFPNWRYVLLATIAGIFYGLAWRRTKSMFPAAVVHTLVDTTWHLLFQTL